MGNLYTKLTTILTRKEKRKFLLLVVIVLLMAVLEVIGIASIMPFMQLVSAPEAVNENPLLSRVYDWLGFESFNKFLLFTGAMVLALMTLSKIAGALTKWMQHRFVWESAHSLSTRLLTTYLYQSYDFFLVHEPTKLQKQVIGEVKQLVREVLVPLVKLTAQGFVCIIIFVLLILVDHVLAFTVLGTLGGSYALVYFAARRYLFTLGVQRFRLFRSSFKIVAETFNAVKSIKTLGCERYFIERFRSVDRRQATLQPKYQVIAEVPQSFIELLAFGGIMVILLYLLALEQSMKDVIPLLSLYALAGHRLMPSLQQSFNALAMLRFNHSVLDSIYQDLTGVPLRLDLITSSEHVDVDLEQAIELRGVSFSYPSSDEIILHDVNLTIERGARVAFVGPTGSGKSTLADIILGLLKPSSGKVLIDGEPLTERNLRAWLRLTGYVPQDVVLIDSSIARNIALGMDDDEIDMERVRKVAGVACIREFIERDLPEGYETRVGERGVRLSGGQRQRIGLARALYRAPRILILDEATSALDGITEESVMEALARLEDEMTVIIIAHRIVTVMDCDRIYLLEEGSIVDAGRYNDLLETSMTFRGLARVAS